MLSSKLSSGLAGTTSSDTVWATVRYLSCESGSMTGAGIDNCTATLTAVAGSGGQVVNLASNNAAVTVPSSVTIASGAINASFTATIGAVSTAQTATLTGSSGGVDSTYTIDLGAAAGTSQPQLSTLNCASGSITGAGTDNCTATLSGTAASGGQAVSLTSNNAAVTVPSSVTVASGATSASFTATVSAVSAAQTATLTASSGGGSSTYAIELNANSGSTVAAISLQSTSVSFGDVALNTSSYQSDTLTASGTASLTISAATVTGTGFSISGVSFPLTLNPGQTATLQIEFDPTVAGAENGKVTLTTNCSSPTSTVSLSGTGDAGTTSYQVNLSWIAGWSDRLQHLSGDGLQRLVPTHQFLCVDKLFGLRRRKQHVVQLLRRKRGCRGQPEHPVEQLHGSNPVKLPFPVLSMHFVERAGRNRTGLNQSQISVPRPFHGFIVKWAGRRKARWEGFSGLPPLRRNKRARMGYGALLAGRMIPE